MTVELLGEDGRLLARQILVRDENPTQVLGLVVNLEYGIPGEAELGRLSISSVDEFGRLKALSSVEVILLATGIPDLNAITDNRARIVIKEPRRDELVQGGVLVVSGLARPEHEMPLIAELIDESGAVVGFRLVNVPAGPPSEHRPFLVEVPYSVNEATWVRLVLREQGERIPGTINLASQVILVGP